MKMLALLCLISAAVWGEIQKPSGFPTMEKSGFVVQYDSRSKIPLWTWEILDKESIKKNVSRDGFSFAPDPDLFPSQQSTLKDYKGSGFDRGHMVPAADASRDYLSMRDSFLLSNICPQNSWLNRGFWARLEHHIRELLRKNEWEKVKVATGPLFLSHESNGKRYVKYEVIGKSEVAVPTHFFKLISAEGTGRIRTWCYIVPNSTIPKDSDFQDFEVPLDRLQKVSGLIFDKNAPG